MDNVEVQKRPGTFPLSPLLVVLAAILLACITACGSGGSSAAATPAVTVATPSISIPTGTYTSAQQVTLTDSTPGSTIYYTTNGAVPSVSSTLYQQPISITASSTIEAIAVLDGAQSAVATSALTINLPPPPAILAFVQQPSNALTASPISPAITVAVEDATGNKVTTATSVVTLALVSGTGLGGTLTATASNGLATFSNVTESTAGNYMLLATSGGLASATSTSFSVTTPISNGTTIMQSMPVTITASSGGTFGITYNWVAVPVTVQSSVFVDFVDSAGTTQFQDATQPPIATSQWNGPLSYTHTITVPSSAAAGVYSVVAGLQSPNGNISLVAGSAVTSLADAKYQIGSLVVAPTCSITSNGAMGDGTTDNLTAIQNTFNYAAANHCIALIPSGTFAYSGNLTATGIAVAGVGASSILKPLSLSNEAIILAGSGGSISNLVMESAATSRLLTQQSAMVWAENADNYYVENLLINDSSSTGIISQNSHDAFILNNTIENTLADSITQVLGSYNITIFGNRILNSGDDGVSNNSYVGDPSAVHTITVQGNTVMHNKGGRGLEVSGGSNIIFSGNYVDNLDGYTDMYIASESEFNTQSVSNVTVSGNSFLDGGPNQGSAIVYNSQAGATTITAVTIGGNQFVNPKLSALEYAGNGSETGISVNNNTDYSNSQFSISSNPDAAPTETGNQVLAPSSYTTPLVPAGGGCNFTGC
jgi:hypothetical protein